MCVMDIATKFLMLTSNAIMAIEGKEEDSKTISLRLCACNLSFFSLLSTKEIQSEKLSITLRSGENSEFKELKDGKHSLNLLAESIKWPLTNTHYLLVSELRATVSKHELELRYKSISKHIR